MNHQNESNKKQKRIAKGLASTYVLLSTARVLSGCANVTNSTPNMVTNHEPTVEPNTKVNQTIASDRVEQEDIQVDEEAIKMAKELSDTYQNKAVRALESVKLQLGEESYYRVIAACGNADSTSSQGGYVADLITNVTENEGAESADTVMRACGYQCIRPSLINSAKTIHESTSSIEEFVQKLNEAGIGENCTYKDNVIQASYEQCYCDISDKDNKLCGCGCYCQCSCGWYEKLFTEVFEQSVTVNLKHSIKQGDSTCDFEIILPEDFTF